MKIAENGMEERVLWVQTIADEDRNEDVQSDWPEPTQRREDRVAALRCQLFAQQIHFLQDFFLQWMSTGQPKPSETLNKLVLAPSHGV